MFRHYIASMKNAGCELLPLAKPSIEERDAAAEQTRKLVEHVRNDGKAVKMVDSLLLEYSLDTQEGILLMSLAKP